MRTLAAHLWLSLFPLALGAGLPEVRIHAGVRPSEIRPRPRTDLAASRVLDVSEYGAAAGSLEGATPAIQAALTEAGRDRGWVQVRLEPKVYRLDLPKGQTHCLRLHGAKRVILDGNGAVLRLRQPMALALALGGCRDILVRHLSVEHATPPMTQGWVREVDPGAGALTVELAPHFPELDAPFFAKADIKWALIKDRQAPSRYKLATDSKLVVVSWRRLAPRRYRVKVRRPDAKRLLPEVSPGDAYVQIARTNGALFLFWNGERIVFQDVRVSSSRGAAFCGLDASETGFLNCRIAPLPGRWHSVNADGIFLFGGRMGPWIEDCQINAIADDTVILKTWRGMALAQVDASTFDIVKPVFRFQPPRGNGIASPWWPAAPGDQLEVFNPATDRRERWRVKSAERRKQATRVVTVRAHPGARVGLTLEDTAFFNRSNTLSRFVIRNNTFRNGKRFGLLLKSHTGLIEGNLFEGHTGPAVMMAPTHQEYGGCVAQDVIIRGNTFRDTYRNSDTRSGELKHFGAISMGITKPNGRIGVSPVPNSREIRRVLLIDNCFEGWRHRPAIAIANARRVAVQGNVFTRPGPHAGPAISILFSDAVQLSENRFPPGYAKE